jgi:hypothetical protein
MPQEINASTFTGISLNEAKAQLYAPFAANQHEQHKFFKFWYLKEEAINKRLTDVFGIGGWDKTILGQQFIPEGEPVVQMGRESVLLSNYPGKWEEIDGDFYAITGEEVKGKRPKLKVVFDIPVILTHGFMTTRIVVDGKVVESAHHSIGGDVLTSLGKERGAQLMNTYKASDTDLLKRTARQVGVGLYLTQLSALSEEDKKKVESADGLGKWIFDTYGTTHLRQAKKLLIAATQSRFETADALGAAIKELGITDNDILFDYKDTLIRLLVA